MKKINNNVVIPKHNSEFFSRFEIYHTVEIGTPPQLVAVGCSFSPFYIVVYSMVLNSLSTYSNIDDLFTVYVRYNSFQIKFLDKLIKIPLLDNGGEEVIN